MQSSHWRQGNHTRRRYPSPAHTRRRYPSRRAASAGGISDDIETESDPGVQATVIPQTTVAHRRRSCHDSESLAPLVAFTAILLCSVVGVLLRSTHDSARLPTCDQLGDSQFQQLLNRVIVQVSKDLIGRRDFALHSSGGRVIHLLTTGVQDTDNMQMNGQTLSDSIMPVLQSGTNRTIPPEVALSHNLRMDHCWRIDNHSGQLGFMLSEMVMVTHVTIDHIAGDMTSDISTAPRRMILWGVIDGEDNLEKAEALVDGEDVKWVGPPITGGYKFIKLTSFSYDIHGAFHIQTFPVADTVISLGLDIGLLVLEVVDNWGGSTTCLYRVRVHGERVVK